jgi:hypothetical protein
VRCKGMEPVDRDDDDSPWTPRMTNLRLHPPSTFMVPFARSRAGGDSQSMPTRPSFRAEINQAANQMRAQTDELMYGRDLDGTTRDGIGWSKVMQGAPRLQAHSINLNTRIARQKLGHASTAVAPMTVRAPLTMSASSISLRTQTRGHPFGRAEGRTKNDGHLSARPYSWRNDSQPRGFFPRYADKYMP